MFGIAKLVPKEHKFNINRCVFWFGSQTVLQWINSDPLTYKTFFMNRLGEISEETNVTEWKWVPTTEDPADDATRYAPNALENNSRWFLGPSFLRDSECKWPKNIKFSNTDLRKRLSNECHVVCNITSNENPSFFLILIHFPLGGV